MAIILSMFLSWNVYADVGDIQCKGIYKRISKAGTQEEILPLQKVFENSLQIQFEGNLKGRSLNLNGEKKTGDFTLSQVWGADFTDGVMSSGSFNSSGRMRISTVTTVNQDSEVYTIECAKTLASQFPSE